MKIALVGYHAAGKDQVAELLEAAGFTHYSLADEIRYEAQKLGQEPTRDNLNKLSYDMRVQEGPEVLAKRALARVKESDKDVVFSAFYHPDEIKVLRAADELLVVEVWAPKELRFERIVSRNRPGAPTTFAAFEAKEQKEEHGTGNEHQRAKVLALSEEKIINDCSLEELREQVMQLIEKHRKE